MKLYGCQFDISWEDRPANYRKVRELLENAAPAKNSLVFLPEMFPTGFSMNVPIVGEDPQDGPTSHFLSECASDLNVYLAGGFATLGADGKARNELAVYDPSGARLAQYAKLHPFTFGGESRNYVAGDRIQRFSWSGTTVSPFICYDLRFPEIFRIAMHGGAEVLAVVANWPLPREEHWLTLLRARAIENQAYVIGVNRCGSDPKLVYFGRSLIIDPHGAVLADAGNGPKVIGAEVDLDALRAYRTQFPILGDLRKDFLRVER